ncbi:hypothetical protein [Aquipuribacter sp. SD81]|uniref:hypothetical protein n=1 Tax=Aquipuribacter sp. SD81 TaxID=3127703 RepID=UPI0030174801
MSFVPLLGLVLASPVVVQALQGARPVQDALVVWLLGMLLAAVGVRLWRAVTTPGPRQTLPTVPLPQEQTPRRRRGD